MKNFSDARQETELWKAHVPGVLGAPGPPERGSGGKRTGKRSAIIGWAIPVRAEAIGTNNVPICKNYISNDVW